MEQFIMNGIKELFFVYCLRTIGVISNILGCPPNIRGPVSIFVVHYEKYAYLIN